MDLPTPHKEDGSKFNEKTGSSFGAIQQFGAMRYLSLKTTVHPTLQKSEMKLFLFWKKRVDGFSPGCSSDVVNKDGISPLACLLMDDGGQRFLDTVPWLDEGMERIKLIKCSGADSADWSRDAWGAELSKGRAKIYSLYDHDCFETLSLDAFEMALAAWRKFIQLVPVDGMTHTLEI